MRKTPAPVPIPDHIVKHRYEEFLGLYGQVLISRFLFCIGEAAHPGSAHDLTYRIADFFLAGLEQGSSRVWHATSAYMLIDRVNDGFQGGHEYASLLRDMALKFQAIRINPDQLIGIAEPFSYLDKPPVSSGRFGRGIIAAALHQMEEAR